MNELTGPVKYDGNKIRTDLLPARVMLEVAEVFTLGAGKYAPYNYLGLSWSRLFAAALRHLWAFWSGEETDLEWGKSHLAHAIACIVMLRYSQMRKTGGDDRPDQTQEQPEVQITTTV